MNTQEAAALLAIAAAFDNRKPDPDAAKAWSIALDGLRFEDCRDVIVAHFKRSREWLMPVDVINEVKRLRAKRRADHPPVDPPSWLDPDDTGAYVRWERELSQSIADGNYHAPAAPGVVQRDVASLGQIGRTVPRG